MIDRRSHGPLVSRLAYFWPRHSKRSRRAAKPGRVNHRPATYPGYEHPSSQGCLNGPPADVEAPDFKMIAPSSRHRPSQRSPQALRTRQGPNIVRNTAKKLIEQLQAPAYEVHIEPIQMRM